MNNLEEKYIDLLLNKCLNFEFSKSLLISYDKVCKSFVDKLIFEAKKLGVDDIYLDEEDINITHEKLLSLDLDEIENDSYFDKSIWNEYASKNANFLMLESEFPGVLDDVSDIKISKARTVNRLSREIFRERESKMEIPWCIAAYPNDIWAKELFGDTEDAYEKLFKTICNICMVNMKDPIKSWDNFLIKQEKFAKKLNGLKIRKLKYRNSLGTNLEVEMPNDYFWVTAKSNSKIDMIVNMPSYEIFSSPHYLKTNGIVYNSKKLVYGGGIVDSFYIKFENGKVVDYDAKVGKEILKSIIETDSNSCYLGEVALVNYDSPISNTNLVFGTTLFDENASCHLALGDGFSECIKNGVNMSRKELLNNGINQSKNHVDFMIGTSDLSIIADTKDGEIILFKDGNFNI